MGPVIAPYQVSLAERRPSLGAIPHSDSCQVYHATHATAPTHLHFHNSEVWYRRVIDGEVGVFLALCWGEEPVFAGAGGIAEHFTQGWHIDELGCQASTHCVVRTRHALHTVWGQRVVMYQVDEVYQGVWLPVRAGLPNVVYMNPLQSEVKMCE